MSDEKTETSLSSSTDAAACLRWLDQHHPAPSEAPSTVEGRIIWERLTDEEKQAIQSALSAISDVQLRQDALLTVPPEKLLSEMTAAEFISVYRAAEMAAEMESSQRRQDWMRIRGAMRAPLRLLEVHQREDLVPILRSILEAYPSGS